jgi:hypothetical protein
MRGREDPISKRLDFFSPLIFVIFSLVYIVLKAIIDYLLQALLFITNKMLEGRVREVVIVFPEILGILDFFSTGDTMIVDHQYLNLISVEEVVETMYLLIMGGTMTGGEVGEDLLLPEIIMMEVEEIMNNDVNILGFLRTNSDYS